MKNNYSRNLMLKRRLELSLSAMTQYFPWDYKEILQEYFINETPIDEICQKFGLKKEAIYNKIRLASIRFSRSHNYHNNISKFYQEKQMLLAEIELLKEQRIHLRNSIRKESIRSTGVLSDNEFNIKLKTTHVQDLDLTVRLYNVLKSHDIRDGYQLYQLKKTDIDRWRNAGKKSIEELLKIKEQLEDLNLRKQKQKQS